MAERLPQVNRPDTISAQLPVIDSTITIDYGDMNLERQRVVAELLTDTGIPLTYVGKVSHKSQPTDRPSLLATWHEGDKELSFYERSDKMHPIKQFGLAAHELMHSVSPYKNGRETSYSSPEAQEKTAELGRQAANQALLSNKYLDGYHSYLARQLHNGDIDYAKFCEETLAIAVQMRYEDPIGLEIKQKSQQEALARIDDSQLALRRLNLTIQHDVVVGDPRATVDVKQGISETLVALMPDIEDTKHLDTYIELFRTKYQTKPYTSPVK